jgi:hypothetical protein
MTGHLLKRNEVRKRKDVIARTASARFDGLSIADYCRLSRMGIRMTAEEDKSEPPLRTLGLRSQPGGRQVLPLTDY